MAETAPPPEPYVSTGELPARELVREWLAEAHRRYAANAEGEVSRVYPEPAQVPGELFGIAVVGINGNVHVVGEAGYEFAIMSVSKPLVSPGKGGMGTFAPPLDAAGNSVKGQLVAKFLSARLGLDLLISKAPSERP
jgi:glutaminase